MSKKNPTSNYRAQLRAQQQAAATKQKRTKILIVVIGLVVLALITMGVVVSQMVKKPIDPPIPSPTATSPTASGTDVPINMIPPNGDPAMTYIEVTSANRKPGALIFDEHLDYQCGHCHEAIALYGETLHDLAESGDIVLRVHLRSFMDEKVDNTASTRAAIGSTCADTVGKFGAYHYQIFLTAPEQTKELWSDEQLRTTIPEYIGITGEDLTAFQTCYDLQQTKQFVQAMETNNSKLANSTPTFFVSGKQKNVKLSLSELAGIAEIDGEEVLVPIRPIDPEGFLEWLYEITAT
ncbi:MAG: thioredoxin domain-containing protein [Propionibacteriaceae bacterium]|jgi:protein-disulfide isomerase|nr:thioredoxin domain-containing protein [Propionibacteriaceae bacterium]